MGNLAGSERVNIELALNTKELDQAMQRLYKAIKASLTDELASAQRKADELRRSLAKTTDPADKLKDSFQYSTAGIEKLTKRQGELQKEIDRCREQLVKFNQEKLKLDEQYFNQKIGKEPFEELRKKVLETEEALSSFQQAQLDTTLASARCGGASSTTSGQVEDLAVSEKNAADGALQVKENLGDAAAKVEALGGSSQEVSSKVNKLTTAMETLVLKGVSKVMTKFQEAGTAFLEFGDGMLKARVVLDETVLSYDAAREAIVEISRDTGIATSKLVDGMYRSLDAGVQEGGLEHFLGTAAKLSVAGLTDLNTAVELLASAMKNYGVEEAAVAEISDRLLYAQQEGQITVGDLALGFLALSESAQGTGVSLEESLATILSLKDGFDGSLSSASALQQVIAGIVDPSAEAAEEAQRLGLAFSAQVLQSRGLVGMLDELGEKVGNNDVLMETLLGSAEAVRAVMMLTGEEAGLFAESLKGLNSASGTTQESFEAISKDSSVRFKISLNELKVQMLELGMALSPFIDVLSIFLSLLSMIDPKLMATVGIVFIMVGAFMAVVKAISGVVTLMQGAGMITAVAQASFMKTTAIILGVVAAFIALAAIIAVLMGKTGEIASTFRSIGDSTAKLTGQVQGNVDQARNRPGYAIGTLSAPRGRAWVGERGPELVDFSGGERVYTATQSAAMAGTAGAGQTVQVVNYNRIDASNLDQVSRLIELLNGERVSMRMGYAGR